MAVYNYNYQIKNKWNSQQIQKQFKNNHHDGLYAGWRKYSNSNHSNSFVTFCNEYQKNIRCDYNGHDIELMDEYEPQYWRCSNCTFDNVERDLYCFICKSLFKSSKTKTNLLQNTLSDYLPSEINNIIHSEDDLDESIQIAIIVSLEENNHKKNYDETTSDLRYKSETKMVSKPTLTGYKSDKTKNKKYCSLTDYQNNEIQIKTKKEWCINKKCASKQKLKQRQHNKRENKMLRQNHAKCMKTFPKLKRLIHKTKINDIKKEIKESYDSEKKIDIKCILNYKILRKFNKNAKENLKIVYHGTRCRNDKNIIEKGLIVGGTKGIGIRSGSAYGRGVYCSPFISTASGYEDGSMFVCVVNNKRVNHFGSIWVVPDDKDILPLFLASFDKESRERQTNTSIMQVNMSNNKSNDGLSQQIIKFMPSFNTLNQKNRKIKRKWNAYY